MFFSSFVFFLLLLFIYFCFLLLITRGEGPARQGLFFGLCCRGASPYHFQVSVYVRTYRSWPLPLYLFVRGRRGEEAGNRRGEVGKNTHIRKHSWNPWKNPWKLLPPYSVRYTRTVGLWSRWKKKKYICFGSHLNTTPLDGETVLVSVNTWLL